MFEKIKEDYNAVMSYVKKLEVKEEKAKMDKILFRLSDNEKANKIWDAMNPNFNEEGGWKIDCYVLDVYDDYALTVTNDGYKRAYYTKNDDDTVTINKTEVCYIVDVTEVEMNALEAMKAANGSYEAYSAAATENAEKVTTLTNSLTETEEKLAAAEADLTAKVEEYETKIADFEAKIAENENVISEANTKYEVLEAEKVGLEQNVADLNNEKDELISFKKSVETNEKEEFLLKYVEHLTETTVEKFKAEIDNYSVEDFKKEVGYAALENDPTIFNKNAEPDIYYKGGNPDDSKGMTGWERILNNYKNGGNK